MWKYERIVAVQASKQIVWQGWVDVEKWPQWDTDLSESAILGELAVGTHGRMKVADDALVQFVVSEVIPEERLAIQISLFGATLTYTYALTEDEAGLKIIHGATISGIFGFVWRMMLKSKISKILDAAQDSFALHVAEEAARQEAEAARVKQAAAAEESPIKAPETASLEAAGVGAPAEAVQDPKVAAPVGDAVENELRKKDIHTQIEVAAQAVVPEVNAEQEPAKESVEGKQPDESGEPSHAEVALLELPKPSEEEVPAAAAADADVAEKKSE